MKRQMPLGGSGIRLRNSVSTKLFALIVGSTLLFVSIVGICSYLISKNTVMGQMKDASHGQMVQAAEKLDFLFRLYERLSVQLAMDQALSDELEYRLTSIAVGNSPGRTKAEMSIRNRLKNIALANDVGIFLYDPKRAASSEAGDGGTEDDASGENEIAYEHPFALAYPDANAPGIDTHAQWFEQVEEAGGQAVWLTAVSRGVDENGEAVSGTSVPSPGHYFMLGKLLRSNSGTYIAIIEIREELFAEALGSVQLGSGHRPTLIDEEGKILLTYEPGLKFTPYELNIPDDSSVIESNGTISFVGRSESTGWKLVAGIPESELTKELNRIALVTAVIMGAAFAASLLLGAFITRLIALPIRKVGEMMSEVENGNLTVRMNMNRQDEIGRLAESFDRMTANIARLVARTNDTARVVAATSEQLLAVSSQTKEAAKEISVATEEIAQGAGDLSQQAEEGSTLSSDMNREMALFLERSSEMEQQARQVKTVSREGIGHMDMLVRKSKESEELTHLSLQRADKLRDNAAQIRKVLELLNDIAKQTNLLSLNAAIEASRAGVHGRGFAVVAQEVRQLADQSRKSLDLAAGIVGSVIEDVNVTARALHDTYPIHREQAEAAVRAETIFSQVDDKMNEFAEQLQATVQTVGQMQTSQHTLADMIMRVSATAQQSSAISEEVASSAQEQLGISSGLVDTSRKLGELSSELNAILASFRIAETAAPESDEPEQANADPDSRSDG
jgi:Methyl-accepting chemotaxis protein